MIKILDNAKLRMLVKYAEIIPICSAYPTKYKVKPARIREAISIYEQEKTTGKRMNTSDVLKAVLKDLRKRNYKL